MELKEVDLFPAIIPRKYPFRTSKAVQNSVEGIFIEIKGDGFTGTGEAAPREHITGETLKRTGEEMESWARGVLGKKVSYALESLYNDGQGPASKIGLEMALLDILAQERNLPICDLLGKNEREKIKYCGFINSDEKEEGLMEKAKKAAREGYSVLRVKVGEFPFQEDYERIRVLREVLGKEVELWLDVNQAWERREAVEYINRLERFNLLMIEQPLDKEDYEGHKEVRDNTAVPIMLDESVQKAEDLEKVISLGCADAVNLKFMKLGSFFETERLVKQASEAGLIVYCGATSVTDIFAMYGRQVEFALPELDYFSMGKPRSDCFVKAPTEPEMKFLPRAPYATRPNGAGLGVRIRHEVLDEYLVKELGMKVVK